MRKKNSLFVRTFRKKSSSGKAEILILVIVLLFAIFIVGGLFAPKRPSDSLQPATTAQATGTCCDRGDGDQCVPYEDVDKTFPFNGDTYGLIKSNIQFIELNKHLKDTNQTTPNGHNPIIKNTSDGYTPPAILHYPPGFECGDATHDSIFKGRRPEPEPGESNESYAEKIKQLCVAIPDDEILYVCKSNCRTVHVAQNKSDVDVYGDENSVFDVYFRLKDLPNPGVPDAIKNCNKDFFSSGESSSGQVIVESTPDIKRQNLHLDTFSVKEVNPTGYVLPWFSPFCKPAIYLYPQTPTSIDVQVKPLGKMNFSIPQYINGWKDVKAEPNGRLAYNGAGYDYLYYEAQIPDEAISLPKEGFVIRFSELSSFLTTTLPKLGLNEKETREFTEYWTRVLPHSAYYTIRIVSQKTLNTIAPLSISPRPDTIIRVTLYFEVLDKKATIQEPTLEPVERHGFTVVEWGGLFKRDAAHPFSCFM